MVVDGPEVQGRAEAGEVARIRRRVGADALKQGQIQEEGVRGKGGVNVQIAEQDLLLAVGRELGAEIALSPRAACDFVSRRACLRHLSGALVAAVGIDPQGPQKSGDDDQNQRDGDGDSLQHEVTTPELSTLMGRSS